MQLNRDVIADAAFRVSARADSETLRIRDIGTELGTDPTAIYRHFRSRDELLFDLVDRVAQGVFERLSGDTDEWRAVLKRGATEMLDALERYPSVGIAAARDRPTAIGELRLADLVLATVLRSGVPEERGVRLYASFSSYVFGAATQLCHEKISSVRSPKSAELPAGDDDHNRPWVGPPAGIDLRLTPTLGHLWPIVSQLRRRTVFDAGIDALLDAMEFAPRD